MKSRRAIPPPRPLVLLPCKYVGGLLCLALPLGVCDAESDHGMLWLW